MTAFGFEPTSFRLDSTVHPFCSSFATTDVRVTTRYAETDLESLFSCMHEIGHGLYERGVSPSLERTPLAAGCSSGLHESQSRLWENVIGRSLPFCRWLHPQLVATFPDALGHLIAGAAPRGDQLRQAVLHPRRRRRGHLRHAHHPAVRARAGADRRHALDRRSARRRGTPGSRSTSGSPSPTTGSACCRTCTGRRASSATSRPTSSAT